MPALALALCLLTSAPTAVQTPQEAAAKPARAAWGPGVVVTLEELDPVLVRRYAMTADGRSILQHMLRTRVLEKMADERGMQVTDADVDRRIATIDEQIRATGDPGGISAQLEANDVDVAEFRRLTRMLVVQERLCREALGIPPGARVTSDQQELWIEKEMIDRGASAPAPPWKDGVAASCGDVRVTAREYVDELRGELPADEVRETCYQMALLRAIRGRMPDLSQDAFERAIDLELERRRRNAAADPQYKGVPYERLLGMQGTSLAAMREDAGVRVMALSRLWVARSYDDATLRETYESERELFDARHGEALKLRVVFLNAAVLTNPLNPRTFDEALAELELVRTAASSEAAFEAAARQHSEDARTRAEGGRMGWIRRGGESNAELRSAAFADLDENGPPPPGGRVAGPIRLKNGAALIWVSAHRPAPGWDEMRIRVQSELRQRFVDDVLSRGELVTFLDV